jgi:hypothetical protein
MQPLYHFQCGARAVLGGTSRTWNRRCCSLASCIGMNSDCRMKAGSRRVGGFNLSPGEMPVKVWKREFAAEEVKFFSNPILGKGICCGLWHCHRSIESGVGCYLASVYISSRGDSSTKWKTSFTLLSVSMYWLKRSFRRQSLAVAEGSRTPFYIE